MPKIPSLTLTVHGSLLANECKDTVKKWLHKSLLDKRPFLFFGLGINRLSFYGLALLLLWVNFTILIIFLIVVV